MDQQHREQVLHVVGGGLAGCEAAWQALEQGMHVVLHEMRPTRTTAAHQSGDFAELVCSNSLKSDSPASAPGCLKSDMAGFNSLILRAAEEARVPAGSALAVDRKIFSHSITSALENHPRLRIDRNEVTRLPSAEEATAAGEWWIVASGPLTSDALARELEQLCGEEHKRLYFYDAIAPVIAADSIDFEHCFRADRYGEEGEGGDYLNLPLSKEQYEEFIDAVIAAEKMPLHAFEKAEYFEACLPIEVMVSRGRETLRFGPLKPVGLTDPRTGRRPYANIQLRLENTAETMYSMVGFQTKMKWPEQRRVFGLIPALREAEFLRFGSVHRNTYVESPKVLTAELAFRSNPRVFLAGQVTGVEGYTESAAIGLLAGRIVAAKMQGYSLPLPPPTSMLGALHQYITQGCRGKYAPMNANLGLLPPLPKVKNVSKADRKAQQCELARQSMASYLETLQPVAACEA